MEGISNEIEDFVSLHGFEKGLDSIELVVAIAAEIGIGEGIF